MNEYISRDKVLNKFIEGDGHDDDRFTEGYNFAVQEHREEVENIPAADVQPVKHGRWITWDDSGFTKCSCCNSEYYISDLQVVGDSEGFVGFCPNCGARMDGEAQC